MSKIIITAKEAPKAIGPYSHAVQVGDYIFASGQIPIDATTGDIVSGGIKEQTYEVFKNISAILNEVSLTLDDVFKTTIFLTDLANFAVVNEIYGSFFKENPPARSCVQVAGLPKGSMIEIEVIAYNKA